ncbi:MAG: zinc transporter ZntB [Ectothiorhodospiraceae bacterium]
MTENDGLICAYCWQPDGAAESIDWPGVEAVARSGSPYWVHLDRTAEATRRWLAEESGLEPLVAEALLQEETRPRMVTIGNGMLIILRGVNLNPGADPEDMVSIRMWVDADRVISLRGKRLLAVEDVRGEIAAGHGPRSPGELLCAIARALVERMGPVLQDLEDGLDALEERLMGQQRREMRTHLIGLRRQGIILRRYIAPQRDVLTRLATERLPLLDDALRNRLRETADRVTRYVEDLDAVRDRAAVVQEELAATLSDQMNRTLYVLSLVGTVFLPLGFITGLLGVNLGGIPGTENPVAFAVLCALLLAVAGFEVVLFYLRRWL